MATAPDPPRGREVTFAPEPEVFQLPESELGGEETLEDIVHAQQQAGFPIFPPRFFPAEDILPPLGPAQEDIPVLTPKEEAPVTQEELDKFKQSLEQITKQFEQIQGTRAEAKKKQEEAAKQVKPVRPLEPITQFSPPPFVLLPALDGVLNPIAKQGRRPQAEFVAVASRDWLQALDEMRAAGWTYFDKPESIEVFLLTSAFIVKQQLGVELIEIKQGATPPTWNYIPQTEPGLTVKDLALSWESFEGDIQKFLKAMLSRKFDYRNWVEKFAICYPEQSRQADRMRRGMNKLFRDIRNALNVTALLPQNWETGVPGLMQCPPLAADFYLGDLLVKDFLRNWTHMSSEQVLTNTASGELKEIPVCSPPPEILNNEDMQLSWIPKEVLPQIMEKYGLVQFKYSTDSYAKFIYTLSQQQTKRALRGEETLVDESKNGMDFINVQDEQGKGYRLYMGELKLECDVFPDRPGVAEGEQTLREWWSEWSWDTQNFPLIHALLNTPAPENRGLPNDAGVLSNYIYQVSGYGLELMSADAPISAFKSQLIKSVIRAPRPGESYADCAERFIRGVYARIYNAWGEKIKGFPPVVPKLYRDKLAELWNKGGPNPEFCTSMTDFSAMQSGVVPPVSPAPPIFLPSAITLQQESPAGIDALIEDFRRMSVELTGEKPEVYLASTSLWEEPAVTMGSASSSRRAGTRSIGRTTRSASKSRSASASRTRTAGFNV